MGKKLCKEFPAKLKSSSTHLGYNAGISTKVTDPRGEWSNVVLDQGIVSSFLTAHQHIIGYSVP